MTEITLMKLEGDYRLVRANEHLGVTFDPTEGIGRQYRKLGFLGEEEKVRIMKRLPGTNLEDFADKIRSWTYTTAILASDVRAGDVVISSGIIDGKMGDYSEGSRSRSGPETVEAISFIDKDALSALEARIRTHFEITRNNTYWNKVNETMKGLERNTDAELFPGMPDEAKQLIQSKIIHYLGITRDPAAPSFTYHTHGSMQFQPGDVPDVPDHGLAPRIYETLRNSIGVQVENDWSQTYNILAGAIRAVCLKYDTWLTEEKLNAKLLVEPPVSERVMENWERKRGEIDALRE